MATTKPELIVDDITSMRQVLRVPRTVKRIIHLLDDYKVGRVMTTRKLSCELGIGPQQIREHATHPALTPYKLKLSTQNYWGNPETVKSYVETRNGTK